MLKAEGPLMISRREIVEFIEGQAEGRTFQMSESQVFPNLGLPTVCGCLLAQLGMAKGFEKFHCGYACISYDDGVLMALDKFMIQDIVATPLWSNIHTYGELKSSPHYRSFARSAAKSI